MHHVIRKAEAIIVLVGAATLAKIVLADAWRRGAPASFTRRPGGEPARHAYHADGPSRSRSDSPERRSARSLLGSDQLVANESWRPSLMRSKPMRLSVGRWDERKAERPSSSAQSAGTTTLMDDRLKRIQKAYAEA